MSFRNSSSDGARALALAAALVAALVAAPIPALAQSAANVLVVANDASPASQRIAAAYQVKRGVPAAQVLHIRTPVTEQVTRAVFENDIETPMAAWLASNRAVDRILYIVLTKDIPVRIAGTPGRGGTAASVDSELTMLYRSMTGGTTTVGGPTPNPWFEASTSAPAERFSHERYDIFLVTRLDGYTADDAIALIDRGLAAGRAGGVLLDGRATLGAKPDEWLAAAADRLRAAGLQDRVMLETTERLGKASQPLLGYASWGSNDPAARGQKVDLTFAPGGLVSLFVSSGARTFAPPPDGWTAGTTAYAGSSDGLIAEMIRRGATGAVADIAEPFLDSTVRPEILFPAYFSGYNLAEAAYRAMPSLSWQSVVIGDPLCSPFERPALTAQQADPGIDADSELPKYFTSRRMSALADLKLTPQTATWLLRAQSREALGDVAGAREALRAGIAVTKDEPLLWRTLANLEEKAGNMDAAIDAYRQTVAVRPKDVIALNNLAYALGVTKGKPEEALPFAERAYALAPRDEDVADTYGWIRYLRGDLLEAARVLEVAARLGSDRVDLQLHFAAALTDAGRFADANKILARVATIAPSSTSRSDYQALAAKLREPAK